MKFTYIFILESSQVNSRWAACSFDIDTYNRIHYITPYLIRVPCWCNVQVNTDTFLKICIPCFRERKMCFCYIRQKLQCGLVYEIMNDNNLLISYTQFLLRYFHIPNHIYTDTRICIIHNTHICMTFNSFCTETLLHSW